MASGSIARDIAYIAQSPRSSLHHGRRRFGNLRCRRACGIPCFGAPILNLVLDDIGQFAGTRRQPRLARAVSVEQTGVLVVQTHICFRVAGGRRPQQADDAHAHQQRRNRRPMHQASRQASANRQAATGLAAARSFNPVKRR